LLPEIVEMLTCIENCELGEGRAQHNVENHELEESYKNL
jgi:hypothetical protein